MKQKIYSHISLGTLILGAATGGYALANIWIIRASLPAGTCPVTRTDLYFISALPCVLSHSSLVCLTKVVKKAIIRISEQLNQEAVVLTLDELAL